MASQRLTLSDEALGFVLASLCSLRVEQAAAILHINHPLQRQKLIAQHVERELYASKVSRQLDSKASQSFMRVVLPLCFHDKN